MPYSELIFDLTTQRELLPKKNIYDRILQLLVGAGWENVSSNPTTDYDVLISKGKNNDRDMTIQFRKFAGTTDSAALNFATGSSNAFAYRLHKQYIPGASGASGTFISGNDTTPTAAQHWLSFFCFYSTSTPVTMENVQMTYYVDADRCFFMFRPESSVLIDKAIWWGFGATDDRFSNTQGKTHRDLTSFGWTSTMATSNPQPARGGTSYFTNNPLGYTDAINATLTNTSLPVQRNYDLNNNFILVPAYTADTTYGIRNELWGVMCVPAVTAGTLSDGDILVDGNKKYEVLLGYTTTTPVNSPANPANTVTYYAIRIE